MDFPLVLSVDVSLQDSLFLVEKLSLHSIGIYSVSYWDEVSTLLRLQVWKAPECTRAPSVRYCFALNVTT
jgi:hypothetical protein